MPPSLIVLPTHAHVARFCAERAAAASSRVALGRVAVTLGELERALGAAALPDVHVLGKLEERLLLREVAASPEARGGRFGKIADTPGFVDALGATLGACRQAGVDAAALREVVGMLPSQVASRVTAVAELFALFDARCDALGAIDAGRVPWLTARALERGGALPSFITAGTRMILRHVHELHPARLALLTALGGRLAHPGELVIELPYLEAGGAWFRAVERALSRIEALSAASITVLPIDPSEGESASARLYGAVARGGGAASPPTHVRLVHAPDPETEHRVVARLVRDLVDAGTPPERIAVAARALAAHAGPLTEALEARGVPVHERRGTPLSLTPPVRWLLGAARAARNGFPRDDVRALLSSSYAGRWRSDVSPDAVARVLDAVGVRAAPEASGGSDASASLLDALSRQLDDPSAPRAASSVRDAVADFATRAAPLAEPGTVLELVARVRRFVHVSGLGDAASRRGASRAELRALVIDEGDAVARADAVAFGRDRAALDALEVALDALAEAASRVGLSGRLDATALHALLEDALSEQAVHDGGLRGGAVRVSSMRDLVGLEMDAVILVGLRDGELPAPPSSDPLLTVSDRLLVARALRARGARAESFDVDEDTSMGRVAFPTGREEEPLVFLGAACAARDVLVLTRACTDDAARPVVASPILEDLRVALDAARAPVVEEHVGIEPAPSPARAAGIEDARRAGVRALAEVAPSTRVSLLAREPLEDRARAAGGGAMEDDPLGLADLLARVAVERRRLAGMLEPGSVEPDRFAGNVAHAAARDRAFAFVEDQPLTATMLEELARCPFQFFAKRGLRLGADALAGDDPDPRQRGTLAHACFQAAIEALVAEGLVPYRAVLADRAAEVARAAAEPVAARGFGWLPFDPVLVAVVRDDTVERVVRVVRAMYAADDGYAPVGVERSFGEPARASEVSTSNDDGAWPALEVPGTGVRVRGRIDLVERAGARVRVADLKSKSENELDKRLQPNAWGATELQLALYAAAAKAATDAAESDARFLSLRDGGPTKSVVEKRGGGRNWKQDPRGPADLTDVVRPDGTPSALAERVGALVARVRAGRFDVRPEKGACAFCDFASVCRIPRGAPDASESDDDAGGIA